LKTKTFISQKSLDTPVFRLIRFPQKVLTALPPLELFSLEEEVTQLPGGLFVFARGKRKLRSELRERGRSLEIQTELFCIFFVSNVVNGVETNDLPARDRL
jgi:hypothetical protein